MNTNPENFHAMAVEAHRHGRKLEAIDYYERAVSCAEDRNSPQFEPETLYNLLCNFSDLLLQMKEFDKAEGLLKRATNLIFEFGDLGVKTSWLNLQKLFVYQGRLQEINDLCSAVIANSLRSNGSDSFRYRMDLVHVARSYGLHLHNMEKCKHIFKENMEWAEKQEDRMLIRDISLHYIQVLDAAGLKDEADIVRSRLKGF